MLRSPASAWMCERAETSRRNKQRAFTLVELMVVVAIIGVLAALAVYGVGRYVASSKTAEAKNTIGAITSGALAAYEREEADSQLLPEGTESVVASHTLCESASAVPATVPAGRKYQPSSALGQDYKAGNALIGWACLRFDIKDPHYYQYHYVNGSSVVPANPAACTTGQGTCFAAAALGDLDGDGIVSSFERTGHVNPTTHALRTSTRIYMESELE